MRNNRKGALPDNRQGSPVLSARQHAAAAQPRPPRTVTYPSVEQAQPPQHLGIHIPHRPDASDHPTDAGHCLTSPPGPNAPTPRRNAPVPFKTLPCRRTPTPHRPDASDNPADTGTRHAPGTASPHRRDPTLQHSAATRQRHSRHFPTAAQRPPHHPDASNHPADTGTRPAPGTKKSGSASRTYSFVSNFSVKNRRLHLAQTNALTQHNQSGAYPLINPCSHN